MVKLLKTKPKKNINLPADVLFCILFYLENDKKSISSFINVNRAWNQAAVPKIWAYPFEYIYLPKIIELYTMCLPYKDRKQLWWRGFPVNNSKMCKPNVNYVAFLKQLILGKLYEAVERWIEAKPRSWAVEKNAKTLWDVLCKLIFTINAQNPSSPLKSLSCDWGPNRIWHQYPAIISHFQKSLPSYSLLNVQKLSLHYIPNWRMLLDLAKCLPNIESLEILDYALSPPLCPLNERIFEKFMGKLKCLRSFMIFAHGTYPLIMLQSIGAQSASLRTLEIVYVNFEDSTKSSRSIFSALVTCQNLQHLVIKNCFFASESHLSLLTHAIFPKLETIQIIKSTYSFNRLIATMVINHYQLKLEEALYIPYQFHNYWNSFQQQILISVSAWCQANLISSEQTQKLVTIEKKFSQRIKLKLY
ncbi:hypothetical protein G9A89_002659 [Geosiphon pyriformis]|nr:hypothetical protein G9A89_002659 [Geosiphon pyriformis]